MIENTKDKLIHRIASNGATREEFETFERLAADEPMAWESLARTLRDEMHLRTAFSEELHERSARNEINRALEYCSGAGAHDVERSFALRMWSGWAVAAVLALALVAGFFAPLPRGDELITDQEAASPVDTTAQHSATLASLTTDEVYHHYLDLGEREGRLVQEMPTILVESRPTDDGKHEVLYLRQLLERVTVGAAYELHEDELGRPIPVPVNLTTNESFEIPM